MVYKQCYLNPLSYSLASQDYKLLPFDTKMYRLKYINLESHSAKRGPSIKKCGGFYESINKELKAQWTEKQRGHPPNEQAKH